MLQKEKKRSSAGSSSILMRASSGVSRVRMMMSRRNQEGPMGGTSGDSLPKEKRSMPGRKTSRMPARSASWKELPAGRERRNKYSTFQIMYGMNSHKARSTALFQVMFLARK